MPRIFPSLSLGRVGAGLLLAALILLASVAAASASDLRLADPAVLEALRASDTPGLPRNLTPGERAHLRLPDLSRSPRLAPSADQLLTAAEFERNERILMRWGNFNSVLTEMIVPITTGDSLARVLLVVSSTAQQNSAATALTSAGANLNRVDFLIAPSDSVWIRDYGPRFSSADNTRIIVDHEYNRPRPRDNQIPAVVAAALGEPLFKMPLNHGGGNFHLFANGEAFMTDLIVAENPAYTAQDVIDLYADYQGLDLTLLPALPASFDSTQHVDMWFLPVDDRTVIIGDYRTPPPGVSPSNQTSTAISVTESTVALMEERGYAVLRTPGWRGQGFGSAHHTYTNAVIVNDLVLICRFNAFPAQNAQAEAVFQQAFPDKSIVSVNCSDIINSSGSLHCIVKHQPDAFFRVQVEQPMVSACVPRSGTSELSLDISLAAINGYSDEVVLMSDGEPAGVSSQFIPASLSAPGQASLVLSIGADAVAGQSSFSVLGSDALASGLPQMISLSLEQTAVAPDLLSPPNLAEQVDLTPMLEWLAIDAAFDYRVQLAADADFSWIVLDEITAETRLSLDQALPPGRSYYWRVSARNDCGEGEWSLTRRFDTRLLTEPESRLFRDRFQPQPEV